MILAGSGALGQGFPVCFPCPHLLYQLMEVSLKRIYITITIALLTSLYGCVSTHPESTIAIPEPTAPITSPEVSPEYLRAHLTAFAHDSMQGREAGTPGHDRAVEYLVQQLERIGAEPAGEGGSYLQSVPLITNALDLSQPLTVDGVALRPGIDYVPFDQRVPTRSVSGAEVIYGGRISQAASMRAEDLEGKFVVVLAEPMQPILPDTEGESPFAAAAGIGVTGLEPLIDEFADYLLTPSAGTSFDEEVGPKPVTILLRDEAAERLIGNSLQRARRGAKGLTLGGDVAFQRSLTPSENIIAVIPGTDPTLRDEYIALGAHTDHMGIRAAGPLDHDSLRAVNLIIHDQMKGSSSQSVPPAIRRAAEARVAREHRSASPRPDSIFNGADDDGSGSIGLLALAEHFSDPENRPRRSILFVWHTAEEKGLIGSEWFTDHPTVPLENIVAHINIDMIGRGSKEDIRGGGPDYLQLLGPKRLSTEYAQLIAAVNRRRERPFRIDEQYDAPGHPEQYYCRSDHWNYARYGIPVAFFSTGSHADYHQLTDEVEYIDFDHYAEVVRFVGEIAMAVGNLDERPTIDGPRPDPTAECKQ